MGNDGPSVRSRLTGSQVKALGIGLIVALIGIVLLAKNSVYDCSNIDKDKIQQTFMACENARKEIEIFKINDNRKDEYLKFSKAKEKNRHCEEMTKLGKNCENLSILTAKASDPYPPCDKQAKELLCEQKMFIWKLWYL